MKVLLDIPDKEAPLFMGYLKKYFSFIKAKPLSEGKAQLIEDIKEAVKEVNQIKAGKKKAKPLSEFLSEL
jgi:hypothetical protein